MLLYYANFSTVGQIKAFFFSSSGKEKKEKKKKHCNLHPPTIVSGLLHRIFFHAIEGPLSVGHAAQEAAALYVGVSVAPVLAHAIQESPVAGLRHVLLEVLRIGENLSALPESLGVGQVCSRQPTGIPHTAQHKDEC